MASFQVLCAEDPDAPRAWREVLHSGKEARPHDELRYLMLMGHVGWLNRLAVYQSPTCHIAYPFHLIPLDSQLFGDVAHGRFVASSPYGYGGPLVLRGRPSETDTTMFFAHLDEWFVAAGAVTEFVREDLRKSRLLLRNDAPSLYMMDNVVVPLTPGRDHWAIYEHKVRKNVKRARDSHVTVEFGTSLRHAELFYAVYMETMERTAAAEHFKMPFSAFEGYLSDESERCSAVFALAMLDGVCVSSEMLLVGSREAYSFLGGTRRDYFAVRPNDMLKHEAILHLSEAGLEEYVLGGGVAPNDGIFKYKRSFAPDGAVPFAALQVVHDEGTAVELFEARKRIQIGWEPREGYFPRFLA